MILSRRCVVYRYASRTTVQGGDGYVSRAATDMRAGLRPICEQGGDRFDASRSATDMRAELRPMCEQVGDRFDATDLICSGNRFLTCTTDFGISSFLDANPKCDMNVSVYVKMAQTR